MKTFKGKAIYQPAGKAAEYSTWACNFYTGCSNACEYCYCKSILRGIWQDKPTLKKCFRDEEHALEIFEKEIQQNLDELQKHGLFFSFTTDPLLPDTKELTFSAILECTCWEIPVKILTKCTDWLNNFQFNYFNGQQIAFGFTLTGHDELELGASTNRERIYAMKTLHDVGFKTFASIEPIIDFDSSGNMIRHTLTFCDLYKIGLQSGRKYHSGKLFSFIAETHVYVASAGSKIYWKDTLLQQAGISRESLSINCVTRDYNLFNP